MTSRIALLLVLVTLGAPAGCSATDKPAAAPSAAANAGLGDRTFPYGHALRAGEFLCDSESAALRCSNRRSGHGFTLAVESYTMF
jgi:hypothetical protein